MRMNTSSVCLTNAGTMLMDPTEMVEFPIIEPPRILVVEDDPEMAALIGALLRRNWFDCKVRHGGTQAIQTFFNEPVDLVLTDLRMRSGDGISLIEAIRGSSRAPVIIITGYADEYADRVRFLDNVALLRKPFDAQHLVDLIDRALDTRNVGTCRGWNVPPHDPDAD